MTEPTRSSIIPIHIKDKKTLYASYMPFVINGGLFIATSKAFDIGQEVFVLLKIMDELTPLPIPGKVVWKTPSSSENYQAVGIGIQFMDQDGLLAKDKIETYLAGALGSERPTYTM